MKRSILLLFITLLSFTFCEVHSTTRKHIIKGEEVSYVTNGVTCKSYVAYDASIKAPRPGILVVPEWWGCNEYARKRARMLAELGYIAIAVDMYGDGLIANDPGQANELASQFYSNPAFANQRLDAAIGKLKEYPETDHSNIAAIGYCFGGSMVLNAAKMSMNFKGVVSFHGNLDGVPATLHSTKSAILVCHGGADKFVSADDIKHFRGNLDSMSVPYTFISYPNATHAFTNPDATKVGLKFKLPIKYNPVADKKSWNDMQLFLKKIFAVNK